MYDHGDTGGERWRQPAHSGMGRYWLEGPVGLLRSVTLVWILGVYDFDVGEWEETPPSVHLSLPLTIDVHPCHLDDVADL